MNHTQNEATPVIDHTVAVREWLAAPFHERGYYWTRVETAWRQARAASTSSHAAEAAVGLLRFNHKLKVTK